MKTNCSSCGRYMECDDKRNTMSVCYLCYEKLDLKTEKEEIKMKLTMYDRFADFMRGAGFFESFLISASHADGFGIYNSKNDVDYFENTLPSNYFYDAFNWRLTPQGTLFWSDLNNKWDEQVKKFSLDKVFKGSKFQAGNIQSMEENTDDLKEPGKERILQEINPLKVQVSGDHYKDHKIQPIEFIHANQIPFCEANAIKYLCRHKKKNGLEDLKKAKHYIDLLIKMEYENENSAK